MRAERAVDVSRIDRLVIAGWTGRDVAAVERHVNELEAIGVKRPKSMPVFYRAAAALLTTAGHIEVLGENSSGEVECVIFGLEDGMWVGLGSDHTDRKVETIGVSLSKQMCAKPVSTQIWRYEEVAPHWDELKLRSYVWAKGKRRLYQEGSVATIRQIPELIQLWSGGEELPVGTAMFCGTLAVHGGVAPADAFEMELEDPVLKRKIEHRYSVSTFADEG